MAELWTKQRRWKEANTRVCSINVLMSQGHNLNLCGESPGLELVPGLFRNMGQYIEDKWPVVKHYYGFISRIWYLESSDWKYKVLLFSHLALFPYIVLLYLG